MSDTTTKQPSDDGRGIALDELVLRLESAARYHENQSRVRADAARHARAALEFYERNAEARARREREGGDAWATQKEFNLECIAHDERWAEAERDHAQAIRDGISELRRYSGRLAWLHDCSTSRLDAEGCEWGIFRVKWSQQGQPVEVWQTLSDMSDLDAEMAREASVQNGRSQP